MDHHGDELVQQDLNKSEEEISNAYSQNIFYNILETKQSEPQMRGFFKIRANPPVLKDQSYKLIPSGVVQSSGNPFLL